ncbi:MAG: ABC transporter ATP-binding protein [Ruminococcus sp.]|nr:ABC transporter ATP-binding protein [Ruminococcus sp.]
MLLELKHIYKTYDIGAEEVPILKDVSLSIEKGDYLAIMGPSGSGKSTLMNIIGCLDKPSSGEYLFEGRDILSLSDNELSEIRAHNIGFVFQSFQLLKGETALQNVMLPLSFANVKKNLRAGIAEKALDRVGLKERMSFLPTQLSGGQKQRVAIARALVNNPDIILADEPTGALDQKSGKSVMELFEKLNSEGVTIVLITHDENVGKRAKKLLHIVDGEILEHKKEA